MKSTFTLLLIFITFKIEAQVMHLGSMGEMGQNGFKANVMIDSLLQNKHLYGLGPYGKMQGEITVIDGLPFVAYADENSQLKVKSDNFAEAPFFVYAYVNEWNTYEMNPEIVNYASLQSIIQKLAIEQGYDLSKPFPFRVEAFMDTLTLNVVSPRSPEIPGYKKGVNNHKYELTNISGQIMGLYSQSGMGVYTHKDSYTHMHFISSDKSKMGHIDALNISAKHKLKVYLPAQPAIGSSVTFQTIDTDFSKGRLTHKQSIEISDLEKFHGHLCDGLIVGALAIQQGMKVLYPDGTIDRTNIRVVSKPSPCLTDASIYLTGGRYQFNTFYVDNEIEGLYILMRTDNSKTVSISLNKGVKPDEIDRLGNIAIKQELSPCNIDLLKKLEDDFTETLIHSDPDKIFTVREISNFKWNPKTKNDYLKIDVLNKNLSECK